MEAHFRLGRAEFSVARSTLECFVSDDDRLFLGPVVETVPSNVEVEEGEYDSWAPKLSADRLFSLRPGEIGSWVEFGRRRVSWKGTAADEETPATLRVYETEPLLEAEVELALESGSQRLRVRGSSDLCCGPNFDVGVPVDVACLLDEVVFLAGRANEAQARLVLGRYLDTEPFSFEQTDGVARLVLQVR